MPNFVQSFFLYTIIFITGLAGLVYQVSWQKYLSRLLGSDSIATAIILAAFLGGLSAGYYLCGKLTTRVRNHLKAYAVLEGIIGIWCLNFPMIFKWVDAFTQYWSFSPPLMIILQGFFCSVLLMGIPTICMGGTIPFLTRGISRNIAEATHVHANVYAINTAGAFLGTLLAGFYLIPEYGLPLTVMGTALLNLGACAYFYLLSKGAAAFSEPEAGVMETAGASASRFSPPMLYAIAFLSGFYVMTLENVLIRITNFSLGSSSYSFSLIVAVFILSIAIGSHVIGRFKDIPGHLLFTNQLLITLSLILVYLSLDTWPYWAHLIRITFQSNMAGMAGYYVYAFSALLMILIVPVSLMGATVPIAFHEIKRELRNVGRHSGVLFSVNTLGNLSGSLIGGILFYYAMNNSGVFLAAALFAGISTCLAGWRVSRGCLAFSVLLTASLAMSLVFTPFYDENRFMLGTFRDTRPFAYSLKGPEVFFQKFNQEQKLIFYEDGPTASVGVVEFPKKTGFEDTPTSIVVNGKSDSSTIGDIYTIRLLAHLPALLAEKRKQAMVIGLGTGVTAGELTLYPDVESVDVAEISPSVINALPLFGEFTHNVHENPKVSVHTGDAFRILGRSRKKWDIIISEPSNPWVTGVDLLFTQEFYKLARRHLSENGILVQWAHIYAATPDMVGMIANTMQREFGNVSAFMANRWDLIFVASDKGFSVSDLERAEAVLQDNAAVRTSLKTIDLDSLDAILIREIWTSSYISEHFSGFGLQTMDNPRLHYMAGKSFFMRRSVPLRELFSSPSAAYADEFLMTLRYEDWAEESFSEETFHMLMLALKDKESGEHLPMAKAVKLKACLTNADFCELSEKEKRILDVLLLIMGRSDSEENWEKAGLEAASFRKKASVLLRHLNGTRNWIVPYPTEGLRKLLKQGMAEGADAYEKNWCAIQMARLLLEEKTDKNHVRMLLNQMLRDAGGNIILKNEDQKLLTALWQMMK